ncbi:glycosyltransferase family 2 protein [Parafilimonas sp.]|uniref:glycosyltransferase family 2 protein n=1 Tax=Parafilimonas sp. TaxID=1969739 RepID=UPI0039E6C320
MEVSVIIPNYNHAPFLEKRIESVLNQTFKDFEVIILDDCSADNSREIIELYRSHPSVSQIMYNEANSGSTFKQWDKGVVLAQGEYIWIAESDDYANVSFLEQAMLKLKKDKSLGLYFCNYHAIDEKGNIMLSNDSYPAVFINYFINGESMRGRAFCEQYLFFNCIISNASGVVFKKSLFMEADKSYMRLKVSGDWRIWVNICYNARIFFDERKLNYFRAHPHNVRSLKASLMGAEAVQNMVRFVKKTKDKAIRKQLKESICKTWVYSFSLNKNFCLNIALIKSILLIDIFFPVRLIKRAYKKLHGQKHHLHLV